MEIHARSRCFTEKLFMMRRLDDFALTDHRHYNSYSVFPE